MKDVYAIYEPKNDGRDRAVGQGRGGIPQPRRITERASRRAASQWPPSDS